MTEVTQILSQIENGEDPSIAEGLLPLVYLELKRLASAKLRRERFGQSLQTTSLVHDAYLRLVDVKQAQSWESRSHFFAAAAEAMRRILVDEARKRKSLKRGGDRNQASGISQVAAKNATDEDSRLLAVNEALQQYEQIAPRASQLVKLKFFAGMTNEEAAEALGISVPTVKRDWALAKVWIYRKLKQDDEG